MSKLNPPTKPKATKFSDERLAGGAGMLAAKQSELASLRRMTLAGILFEGTFYVDGETSTEQIRTLVSNLVKAGQGKAVLDLAVECRQMQKMRHMPLFLVTLLLKSGYREGVAEALPKIITRVDMMADLLNLYASENGGKVKPLAKALQTGIANSFFNFDEYQFGKYKQQGHNLSLSDVIRLTHPTPGTQDQSDLFARVRHNTLATPDTWEVGLSSAKNDVEKRLVWQRLIDAGKLPPLAFLRNLRNMRKVGVPMSVIEQGFANVRGGMLLPINFWRAYKENPEFSKQIEDLMLRTYRKMPKLPGRTAFVVDRSGSMCAKISDKSGTTRQEVANLMAMLAVNMAEDCALIVTAGSDYDKKHSSVLIEYPNKGFGLLDQITKSNVGLGGIFTRQMLEWGRENLKGDFDRIIVFSDSQDCDYSERRTPNPWAKYNYIVDVSADKNGINYKGVWTAEISGWSEHFLTYIAAMEGLENEFQQD